ncbi:hypothetical protein EDC04DRAFT_2895556 [Pisolithus marmoratus]|nr:hypothetical protein EDC04DRAFT_2895556 [Pisolithus marmoratus]
MSIRHPYAAAPSSYLYANVSQPYSNECTITHYRSTQTGITAGENQYYYYYYRPPTSQLRSFIPSLSSDSLPSRMLTPGGDGTTGSSDPDSNFGFSRRYPNRRYQPQISRTGIGGRVRVLLKDFGESVRTRRFWGASPRNPYVSRVPPLLCCCDIGIDDYERSVV